MNNDEFNSLIKIIEEFLEIDMDNMNSKGLLLPKVTHIVIDQHRKTMLELDNHRLVIHRVEGLHYDKFRKHPTVTYTKAEIEKYYIPTVDEVIKLRGRAVELESHIFFLETTLKNLTSMGFNIKNVIEYEKFRNGEF